MKKMRDWTKEDWNIFFDGEMFGMVLCVGLITVLKIFGVM